MIGMEEMRCDQQLTLNRSALPASWTSRESQSISMEHHAIRLVDTILIYD